MTHARVLAGRLAELLRTEQGAMADFLVAVADFDRRRGWEELGYRSLFDFLRRDLKLSSGAAHYRKTAALLVQRFPDVVDAFRDGRLCITAVVPVASVVTPENYREMLPKFFGLSRREAMALAAAINPATAAPHRDIVTALRPPATAARRDGWLSATGDAAVQPAELRVRQPLQPHELTAPGPLQPAESAESVQPAEPEGTRSVQPAELPLDQPSLLPMPPSRDAARPLTADLSRLHVTVSSRFLRKLEEARAALSHARPCPSAEQILEAGLDLLLEKHRKRKGLVKKPQTRNRPARVETLTAAVKREVWTRDGGRCQWPLESGGVCGSTHQVQFAHRVARALGGPPSKDNIYLLCGFHNDLDARRVFGDARMNQFTRRPLNEPEQSGDAGAKSGGEPPPTSESAPSAPGRPAGGRVRPN